GGQRQGARRPPEGRRARAARPAAAGHDGGAEPAARPGGGSLRTQSREGRPRGADSVRHPGRDRAPYFRALPEPSRGPPLFLQTLPGEPDPARVRVRGGPHRPQGKDPPTLSFGDPAPLDTSITL